MKKYKAIEQMKLGKKITHDHFSQEEWMTIVDGKILLEDGVKCHQFEFWKWRMDESWNDGYSIYDS